MTITRKAMIRQHQERLKNYIFDGTMLFTVERYTPNPAQPLLLTCTKDVSFRFKKTFNFLTLCFLLQNDPGVTQASVRLVGECQPTDFHYIQFFNIVLRKCMEGLDLQLLGRNYFDPKARIMLPDYKLELWPGYVTSIRQHERELLMCCEISTKILRTDTVLDQVRINLQPRKSKMVTVSVLIFSWWPPTEGTLRTTKTSPPGCSSAAS